jgi:hypothetical protein
MKRRSALGGGFAVIAAGFTLLGIGAAQAAPAAVMGFGSAASYGAPASLSAPVAGIAATRDGRGYWLVGADGGVFAYGDASYYGSASGGDLGIPVVGIAATKDGKGYWVSDYGGLVSNFGDAPALGDLPDSLVFPTAPIVGIASDSAGEGYWLVGADGGVFGYGAARFHGSLGGIHLDAPIVGIAATPDGGGYWLVGADGGVFSFGDAPFKGSEGGDPPASSTPVVAIASSPASPGYWLATSDQKLPSTGSAPSVLAACDFYQGPAEIEPSSIVLACADGNASLINLNWSSWTATGAVGSGTFRHNLCQPDCVDGQFAFDPTQVRLSYPIESGAGQQFSVVSYTYGGHTETELLPVTPVG